MKKRPTCSSEHVRKCLKTKLCDNTGCLATLLLHASSFSLRFTTECLRHKVNCQYCHDSYRLGESLLRANTRRSVPSFPYPVPTSVRLGVFLVKIWKHKGKTIPPISSLYTTTYWVFNIIARYIAVVTLITQSLLSLTH